MDSTGCAACTKWISQAAQRAPNGFHRLRSVHQMDSTGCAASTLTDLLLRDMVTTYNTNKNYNNKKL